MAGLMMTLLTSLTTLHGLSRCSTQHRFGLSTMLALLWCLLFIDMVTSQDGIVLAVRFGGSCKLVRAKFLGRPTTPVELHSVQQR